MEARLVEIADDQGIGVGLVVGTYDVDHDGKFVVSEPILTAYTSEELRPHVNNLVTAFEYPVLTADEYDAAVESGSFPEPVGPTGDPQDIVERPGEPDETGNG